MEPVNFRTMCQRVSQNEAKPDVALNFITETFKALGALKAEQPGLKQQEQKQPTDSSLVELESSSEGNSTLYKQFNNYGDLMTFTLCAKNYFKNNAVEEAKAGELLQNLNSCLANPGQGIQFFKDNLQKAKQQLLLHEQFEPAPVEMDSFVAEVAQNLTTQLEAEQKIAIDSEKEMKKADKLLPRYRLAATAGATTAVMCMFVSMALLVAPPLWVVVGLPLFIIGL